MRDTANGGQENATHGGKESPGGLFFSLAFRNAASGMAITDQYGRFLQVNHFLCEFLGYTEDELGQRSLNDISHPEDQTVFSLYVERLSEGEAFHIERRFVHKCGRIEWGLHSVSKVSGPNGLYLSQIQEITEFKRVEEELRQSEERMRMAISVLAEGIILVEPGGNVRMNESARRILGRESVNLDELGAHIVDEDGNPLPAAEFPLQKSMRTGEPISDRMLGLVHEGGIRWALVNARPLFYDASGKPTGTVVSFTDVTERRHLEEQLRHSQRMESVGRLAGGMAHDFNNLLMAILGEASVRLMDKELSPALRKSLESIAASSRRGALLTRKLLTFSRRQVFEPKVFDMYTVVNSLHDLLQRLLSGRVTLESAGSAESLVRADRNMLEQVLINLALNANDAMPNGGRLRLTVAPVTLTAAEAMGHPDRRPGHFVCLSVSDTGVGMSAETQERIFEPYFTTKPPGKGTGLGLSIVYGIIHQLDGWIELTSTLGAGTEFRIYLEQATGRVAETVTPPERLQPQHTQAGKGQGILVVEDDFSVRELLTSVLEGDGYQVFAARSGADGLRLLQGHHDQIGLVLTDVLLDPEMNGFELAAQVQSAHPSLPIVYASGYQEKPPPARAKLVEGENFLAKPFELPALLNIVRQQLAAQSKP